MKTNKIIIVGSMMFLAIGIMFLTGYLRGVTVKAETGTRDKPIVFDDFIRFTTQKCVELGTMTDGVHKWVKRVPIEKDGTSLDWLIHGSSGRLCIGYKSGLEICDTGVAVADFMIKNGIIELKVAPSGMSDKKNAAYINYRASAIQSAAGSKMEGAYHVGVSPDWSKKEDVGLFFGKTKLISADVAESSKPADLHSLKVMFKENRHVVWIDGKKIIDFLDSSPERNKEGQVGFGGWYSCGYFDEFALYKVEDLEE